MSQGLMCTLKQTTRTTSKSFQVSAVCKFIYLLQNSFLLFSDDVGISHFILIKYSEKNFIGFTVVNFHGLK